MFILLLYTTERIQQQEASMSIQYHYLTRHVGIGTHSETPTQIPTERREGEGGDLIEGGLEILLIQ
jgi:hypothetical protein